jgi:hypothetical protein
MLRLGGGNNALFGPGGKISRLFPDRTERLEFCRSNQYQEIADLLASLPQPAMRPDETRPRSPDEVNGTILLRVPRSLHAALFAEAQAEGVSLNQLCVTKLSLQLGALV